MKKLTKQQQDWLSQQPKLIRHDIYISSLKDIFKYLNISIDANDYKPRYNSYKIRIIHLDIEKPQKNLIAIYLKSRNNPFKIKYPSYYYSTCSLENLLKYDIAIEEAYIFWKNPKLKKTKIN